MPRIAHHQSSHHNGSQGSFKRIGDTHPMIGQAIAKLDRFVDVLPFLSYISQDRRFEPLVWNKAS